MVKRAGLVTRRIGVQSGLCLKASQFVDWVILYHSEFHSGHVHVLKKEKKK